MRYKRSLWRIRLHIALARDNGTSAELHRVDKLCFPSD